MTTLRNLPVMVWALIDAACLAYLAGVIVGMLP